MAPAAVDVLMVGAGEYTAGFVQTSHGAAADKPAGVVALTCFDLRRFGKVGRMVLCDRSGTRMPAVRACMASKIGGAYRGLDLSLECFPADDVADDPDAATRARPACHRSRLAGGWPAGCLDGCLATASCCRRRRAAAPALPHAQAIASMKPGDACIIFTPDDSHFAIASAAISAGLHVLVAKPIVKTLEEHKQLVALAKAKGVLLAVEYHKRFDPIYSDARNRVRQLGPFSYYYSYMAQPKQQLDTFKAWAGKSSDINFYLNSHHIDVHNWFTGHTAQPVRVTALAATGVAEAKLGRPCEDTITLSTLWRGREDGSSGTAVYTASWIAPKGECHTRQHFHYMGQTGEVHADQAHRGYSSATDAAGYAALNPLYMRYTPDANGFFAGQTGYGYISISSFIEAAAAVSSGARGIGHYEQEGVLALASSTLAVTAILQAGRLSLDNGGAPVDITYDAAGQPDAVALAQQGGAS